MTLTGTGRDLLDDDLLDDFDGRAPVYDRHNAFFNEDFEELRRRGYLLASVPEAGSWASVNLDGVVSIVTGASGGIGRVIAVALAEQRGRIVVTGRRVANCAGKWGPALRAEMAAASPLVRP